MSINSGDEYAELTGAIMGRWLDDWVWRQIQRWDDLGLTLGQLRVLAVLAQARGTATASYIAEHMAQRPSNISAYLGKLQQAFLIDRRSLPAGEDQRITEVLLTPKGAQMIDSDVLAARAFVIDHINRLGPASAILLCEAITKADAEYRSA